MWMFFDRARIRSCPRRDDSMSARSLLISIVVTFCVAICGLVPVATASAAALPDGRLYEMVTPPENYGSDVYQPRLGIFEHQESSGTTETNLLFQSAAAGNRVAYVAAPTVGGNELAGNNGGNEYLGVRGANGGWTQSNLSPVGAPSSVFQAFSSDLSVGFLDAIEPLSSTAPGFGENPEFGGNYDVLYSTLIGSNELDPAFEIKPPFRSMERFGTAGNVIRPGLNGGTTGNRNYAPRDLTFIGASADSSHILFMANDALTGASEGRPAAEGG